MPRSEVAMRSTIDLKQWSPWCSERYRIPFGGVLSTFRDITDLSVGGAGIVDGGEHACHGDTEKLFTPPQLGDGAQRLMVKLHQV